MFFNQLFKSQYFGLQACCKIKCRILTQSSYVFCSLCDVAIYLLPTESLSARGEFKKNLFGIMYQISLADYSIYLSAIWSNSFLSGSSNLRVFKNIDGDYYLHVMLSTDILHFLS